MPKWRKAVMGKMRALERNKTWEVIDLVKRTIERLLGCKRIYTNI